MHVRLGFILHEISGFYLRVKKKIIAVMNIKVYLKLIAELGATTIIDLISNLHYYNYNFCFIKYGLEKLDKE